ncbi:MAG: hypothetical protein JNL11_09385 [Bdellovibrionaceae bacterium]|nr:hypothetical protein [Pseudobdellovibrionaceae bacterium]
MLNKIYDLDPVNSQDPRALDIVELNLFKKKLRKQLFLATIVGAALAFLFFVVTAKFILIRKILVLAVPLLYFLFLLRVKRVHNIAIQAKRRDLQIK